jgi:hypothetical protein
LLASRQIAALEAERTGTFEQHADAPIIESLPVLAQLVPTAAKGPFAPRAAASMASGGPDLLDVQRLQAHAALAVERVGEGAAREHQAHGRSPATATLSTAWLSHR